MPTEPNVRSFTSKDKNGQDTRFTVSTEIVDYIHAARAFGTEEMGELDSHGRYQTRMVAIPDLTNTDVAPMLLTIGSGNRLRLVRRGGAGIGGGWVTQNLSTGFPDSAGTDPAVRAIAAAWSNDGRITIAAAVGPREAKGADRLLIAYDLNSEADAWNDITWTDCGTRADTEIHGLRVLEDEHHTWTTVVDASGSRVDTLYLIRSNSRQELKRAYVYSPAVDYQEIHDFEPMIDPYVGAGIAVLGSNAGAEVLTFRPFPEFDDNGKAISVPPVVPLPCPKGARLLETGQNRNDGHDLYISGEGVFVISAEELDNHKDAKVVELMGADVATKVRRLNIAESPDGAVSVWALGTDGNLLTVRSDSAEREADALSTPLRLRADVQGIAPVYGDGATTTAMIVTYTNGQVAHVHRDAASGAWLEAPVLVDAPSEVVKMSCYGVALRMMDSGGMPQMGCKVMVSASAAAHVVVNGKSVFIGPNVKVEATTDANGAVNLYDKVRTLAPPVYRFEIETYDNAIDINPAATAHERLASVTAQDLLSSDLLPAVYKTGARQGEVEGMVAALNHIAALAKQVTNGVLPGVRETNGTAFSNSLKTAKLPVQSFALTSGASGIGMADTATADRLIKARATGGDEFAALGDTLSDFFEGIWQGIQDGWTFVVNMTDKALEFICEIGGKIRKFVLETLEEIGGFFTWLWEQMNVALEKVWEFLKFVFNWDDVLLARDVMVNATDQALIFVRDNISGVASHVAKGFGSVKSQIRDWKAEFGVPITELPPVTQGDSFADMFQSAGDALHGLVDQAVGNPVMGWITDQFGNIMDEVIQIDVPEYAPNLLEELESFVAGTLASELDNITETWTQIQADVHAIVGNEVPTTDLFSFDTFAKIVVAAGADAAIGLLNAVEILIIKAIELAAKMIDGLRAILFSSISFPFIEKLIKLVAPGSHVDTSFRLIDAVMLVGAIPATIAYKLIVGKAPFKPGDEKRTVISAVMAQDDDFAAFFENAKYFLGIGAACLKMAAAGYFAIKSFKDDFSTSTFGSIVITVFAALGAAATVFTRHDGEGDEVSALEWTIVVASTLSAMVAAASVFWRVDSPIPKPSVGGDAPFGHKFYAWTDLGTTSVSLVCSAVAFGFIMDRIGKSKDPADRSREAPEGFRGSATFMDAIGTITSNVATILPMEAAKVKAGLLIVTGGAKAAALTYKSLELAAAKKVIQY
ncbi:hypothetical protein [Thalassococcus sp. S3]|uniref:hypothetical protein n=1 Tax=Thalassococcus sp. S3 TaxID=2017482 RepID=UPI0010247ECA|nr:hypothetical protein [Thalassococcus sp. S3]QBF33293.1 hypothetical protein CFI11_18995 [Thalassococcus sp. S3]